MRVHPPGGGNYAGGGRLAGVFTEIRNVRQELTARFAERSASLDPGLRN